MYKFCRFLPFFLFFGVVVSGNANDCLSYKIKPKIVINVPEYNVNVIQSQKPMNLLHGNVVATLVNNYDIIVDITPVNDGYCVSIKGIDATIGYNDFLIKINKLHKPQTCSYNAIVSHENKHIDAYLSVIDDNKNELYKSLYSAADSIIPVFVNNKEDVDGAIEKLNNELQSHPDIILIIQKIHADEEIKNKYIDRQEDYTELKKCL